MSLELALPLASDAVAVAGVHAAIVAIFMAMLVAYWGFMWGWIQPLRQRAIDRANSLEQTRITNRYMYEGLEEDYDGHNQLARLQHIANVDAITLGRPAWSIDTAEDEPNRREDPRVPPSDNPPARVHYLVATLSLMRRSYPLHGADFGSLSEIRPWLSDALDLLQRTKKSLHFTERYVETIVGRAAKNGRTKCKTFAMNCAGKKGRPRPMRQPLSFCLRLRIHADSSMSCPVRRRGRGSVGRYRYSTVDLRRNSVCDLCRRNRLLGNLCLPGIASPSRLSLANRYGPFRKAELEPATLLGAIGPRLSGSTPSPQSPRRLRRRRWG